MPRVPVGDLRWASWRPWQPMLRREAVVSALCACLWHKTCIPSDRACLHLFRCGSLRVPRVRQLGDRTQPFEMCPAPTASISTASTTDVASFTSANSRRGGSRSCQLLKSKTSAMCPDAIAPDFAPLDFTWCTQTPSSLLFDASVLSTRITLHLVEAARHHAGRASDGIGDFIAEMGCEKTLKIVDVGTERGNDGEPRDPPAQSALRVGEDWPSTSTPEARNSRGPRKRTHLSHNHRTVCERR